MSAVRDPLPFAELLRRHRSALDLTQQELAERAGLSVRGLRALENGTRLSPHRHTVRVLADALELDGQERRRFEAAARTAAAPPLRLVSPSDADQEIAPPKRVLPWQPTPFIGREQEVVDVAERLGREDMRLLTLIGPGGTGKTRLALEAGRAMVSAYADGVCFVPLAALRDAALVPGAIAQALGLAEQGRASIEEVVLAHLESQKLLLVLDNFEQLLDGALWLPRLLEACRDVDLLVTSRIPLRLAAEQRYPVPPLHLPAHEERLDPAALAANEAVRLFVTRAQAVQPAFQLTATNAHAVAEICVRLDGLPLAIELAAAQSTVLTPFTLLDRLGRRLSLLSSELRDVSARHQTLRATLDWSYSLLTPAQQTLLARLSVFAGGATFDAIEAVCDPAQELPVLPGMAALVEQSLVRREGEEEQPRFLALETIREYAAEQLVALGQETETRDAHAGYYRALAQQAEPELRGPRQGIWLARLDHELGNLRVAMVWFLEQGRADEELQLATALRVFWVGRGYWSEGLRWLEDGLKQTERIAGGVRGWALVAMGDLLRSPGEHQRVIRLLEEAVSLLRGAGDAQGTAYALGELGFRWYHQGDRSQAMRCLEESITVLRQIEDRRGVALASNRLGIIALEVGDFSAAEARLSEALALFRSVGEQSGIADGLNNLGYALLELGKLAEARQALEESLALAQALALGGTVPYILDSLACVALRQEDSARASVLLAEALELSRDQGNTSNILTHLGHLVEAAIAQGQAARGAQLAGAEVAAREITGAAGGLVADERRQQALARARDELGEDAFQRAWSAGKAMPLEAAIAYALQA